MFDQSISVVSFCLFLYSALMSCARYSCRPSLPARATAFISASPETRLQVCKVLLDYMRRSLAIKVDYLDPVCQDSLKHQSSQYLKTPWALDEMERLSRGAVLYPRARGENGVTLVASTAR